VLQLYESLDYKGSKTFATYRKTLAKMKIGKSKEIR